MGRRAWGTVRRLPSGRYQARYPDGSGKQISAPQTFATKADGNRWLAKVQTERAQTAHQYIQALAALLQSTGQSDAFGRYMAEADIQIPSDAP